MAERQVRMRGTVFEQAGSLALAAAVSPPAALIAALYLRSARPGHITLLYVLGGLVVVTAIGIAVLLAVRAGGLSLHGHQHTRYGLRLGLGVLAIIAAFVIARRRPKPKPGPEAGQQKKTGFVSRLVANPTPRTA